MILKGKKINFLGDSITEGVGTSGPGKIYHAVLAKEYELKSAENYGISGTRFAEQKNSSENKLFDENFCSRTAKMDPDADAVVVFGGTNDFGHGDAPFGCFSDRTAKTFRGACHVLMGSLLKLYPGKPVVIITPLHRLNEDNLRGDGFKEAESVPLKAYVDAIRETAEYYSLPVLDLYASSGIQPNIPKVKELLCPDGLHPNDAGHAIIAERLANFLRNL